MAKIDVSRVPEGGGSGYPAPFHEPCVGRIWKELGEVAGLTQFGVVLLRLPPGVWSSQRHWHAKEDEFAYLLEGEVVLVTDAGEEVMRPGDCAGFKAGSRDGHHVQNRSDRDAVLLVVGSRLEGEHGEYSDIDMAFRELPGTAESEFVHKDGTPYPRRQR